MVATECLPITVSQLKGDSVAFHPGELCCSSVVTHYFYNVIICNTIRLVSSQGLNLCQYATYSSYFCSN